MMLELPEWAAWGVSILLVLGAGLTLIGSVGLLRLDDFFKRTHAPTLGTTLGALFICLASSLYFSVGHRQLLVHEILIVVFITLTTPVGLMLLARAALFREREEGRIVDQQGRAPVQKPRGEQTDAKRPA